MKGRMGFVVLLLVLLGTATASIQSSGALASGTHHYRIRFYAYFISGDNVDRDFYIEVDGEVVSHGIFLGSGELTAPDMTLTDASNHVIEAWPIINRDRSIYGGKLYLNSTLCAEATDIHQESHLICTTGVTMDTAGTIAAWLPYFVGVVVVGLIAGVLAIRGILARREKRLRGRGEELWVHCRHCGTQVAFDAKFCRSCGARL